MSRAKASLLMMVTAAATAFMLLTWPVEEQLLVYTVQVQPGELVQSFQTAGVVNYAQLQPCISPKTAKVAAVHVSAGQRVEKGDLLFSLDTSAEEKALAALQQTIHDQQEALEEAEPSAAAMAQYFSMEWVEKETKLRAMIDHSAIRAELSGTVEAVYVQEGSYALAQDVLGVVRGEEKCIEVTASAAEWAGIKLGTAAVVEENSGQIHTARLSLIHAPEETHQAAVFQSIHPDEWMDWPVGQRMTIQVLKDIVPAEALIPLQAVDENRCVWYVENGTACCEKVDVSLRNAEFVAEGSRWAGRRVILSPQLDLLQQGMAVREAVK